MRSIGEQPCATLQSSGSVAAQQLTAHRTYFQLPRRNATDLGVFRPPSSFGNIATRGRRRAVSAAAATDVGLNDASVDVCVVGAGIIGLTAAAALLQADPTLTVALLDQRTPCAGATGAGQGYVWMAHRDPTSAAWQLAARSKLLWEELLSSDGVTAAVTPEAVEWQQAGSVLVATDADEAAELQRRTAALHAAGVSAAFLDAAALRHMEPALHVADGASGLLVSRDSQLNGRQAAAALLAACAAHGSRFVPAFHEGCEALLTGPSGRVEGVQTSGRRLNARVGVVLACGAWAGDFLARQLAAPGWAAALCPRRGHLLEMPRPEGMPLLRRGLMEMGYTKHYSSAGKAAATAAAAAAAAAAADISFTATTSATGTLLVGSSREFSGWGTEAVPGVVDSIMARAVQFLPGLAAVDPRDISVRVGLRPFSPSGPMVGPVPGTPGLLLAAGHEGSGLTLGPATAELVVGYLLGREPGALPQSVVASVLPKPPAPAGG